MDEVLCPELIGRSAELGVLTSALAAAAAGEGGALFLTGDEGAGKSRLAREFRAAAQSDGFLVLTGRGTRSAVPVPYRPVAEALIGAARASVCREPSDNSGFRAVLGNLVPEWRCPGDKQTAIDPVVVGDALLRLLSQPGRPGGVLVLEDLHWADPETLAITEYLADNCAGTSVLCLLTVRDAEPSAGLDLLQSAAARRVATAMEVRRLTPAQVHAMARECLRTPELPGGVDRLLARCDGLPFAVEEILAAAVASGELVRDGGRWHLNEAVATDVPALIADSVRSRLLSLSPQARDIVSAAAILGRQFDWTLLPAITKTREADVLAALRRAADVQLVEPAGAAASVFRFRHNLTREVILADLMPPERARRAGAAATAIVAAHPRLPGSWCELVAELSVQANQPADAARLLVTSGRRALRQGAMVSAKAVLTDASRLVAESTPADDELALKVDELRLAAFALTGASDQGQLADQAGCLLERLVAAGADPRRRGMVHLAAAGIRRGDDPAEAPGHLAAARAIAAALTDEELSARADAIEAHNALAVCEAGTAETLARKALAVAESAGLTGWAAEVGLLALEVIGRLERFRDLDASRRIFERSVEIAGQSGPGIWRVRTRHELSTTAMLTDGRAEHLVPVRDLADRAGAAFTATAIRIQLANIASLGSDLDDAFEQTVACQQAAARINAPGLEAVALCLQGNVTAVSGDRRLTERAARQAEQATPGKPEIRAVTWGASRTLASLFSGDLPRAIRESKKGEAYAAEGFGPRCGGLAVFTLLQAPILAPRRSFAIRAVLAAISGDDARAAIDSARAVGADTSWNAGLLAYAEAVLAGQAGQPERATALADQGHAELEKFAPWWRFLTWRLVAPAAFADGWGSPACWLRAAIEGFSVSGHDQLASACRSILREAGQPVPRAGRGHARVPADLREVGVTSREMDVLELLARGQSNSQIAARLYISPKTVDTHVASLIAKTGKGSRHALVAHAARFDRA